MALSHFPQVEEYHWNDVTDCQLRPKPCSFGKRPVLAATDEPHEGNSPRGGEEVLVGQCSIIQGEEGGGKV
jgi:hypothetical protein